MQNTDSIEVKRAAVIYTLGEVYEAQGNTFVYKANKDLARVMLYTLPPETAAATVYDAEKQELRVDTTKMQPGRFVTSLLSDEKDENRSNAFMALVQGVKDENVRQRLSDIFSTLAQGLTAEQALKPALRAAFNTEAENVGTIVERAGLRRFLSQAELTDAIETTAYVADKKAAFSKGL